MRGGCGCFFFFAKSVSMEISWNDIADSPMMMEMLPGGYYICRAEGNGEIIAINSAAMKIYGCSSFAEFKELTGATFRGMVHPLDLQSVDSTIKEQLSALISEDKNVYIEFRIVRADGKTRLASNYAKLVRHKTFGDIFCIFIDDASEKIARVTKSLAPQFFKISKVNLTKDAFVVVKKLEGDYVSKSKKFSVDMASFVSAGYVHGDDIAYFTNSASLEALQNYFQKGGTNKVLRYRRKISQQFCWVTMTITRAEEYTNENQVVAIFERIADDGFISLHEDFKKAELVAGLSSGYDSIYIYNIEKNEVSPFMLSTPLSKRIDDDLVEQYSDYSLANRSFARKFVCPQDRQRYLLQTSTDYILRMLTHSKRYEVVFRQYKTPEVHEYIQLSVCRVDDQNLTRVLLGYKNITKQFVEETEKSISRHMEEILHFVADDFVFLNEIDLDSETERQFFLSDDEEFSIPRWSDSEDFRECITAFARKYVAPHDLERFMDLTRLDNLKKVLSSQKSFIITYDAVVKGRQRRFEGRFTLRTNASGKQKILVGTRDITFVR